MTNIIRERTILPFYLPLKTEEIAQQICSSLEIGRLHSLKFNLGILTSRFRANHPLKACPDCMRHDKEKFHVAYWHVKHQLPGVWVCQEHKRLLMQAKVKTNGVGRFEFYLPAESLLEYAIDLEPTSVERCTKFDRLMKLAEFSIGLAALPKGFRLHPNMVVAAYARAMQDAGMMTKSGRIRMKEVAETYREFLEPFRAVQELKSLPGSAGEATTQIRALFRMPFRDTHPLRLLAFSQWIFDRWEHFLRAYESAENVESPGLGSDPTGASATGEFSIKDALRLQLRDLVRNGSSVSAAAKELSLDVTTAMAWLAQDGISTTRRPKKLKDNVYDEILGGLRQGEDKAVLAARLGTSIQTITRTLRTTVGLHDEWLNARRESARSNARGLWVELIEKYPSVGVKMLRLEAPAVYAWLYRNDCEWLVAHQPKSQRPVKSNFASVRWDARDLVLSAQVKEVILRLSEKGNGTHIALWQICQSLPELKAKLDVLDRLPLTRRALDAATKRRRRGQSKSLF